jgi:peptidoglycan/LPS O-acetylase OafA/YrhL
MAIGVASAILFYNKQRLFMLITTHTVTQILSWAFIALLALNKFHIASLINHEFISLVTVCLIMGQITKKSIISLENAIFNFIGKISYGIYVIHMVLILYLSKLFGPLAVNLSSYLLVYFTVITLTIFFAWLSYHFFEKKFLLMKEKYSIVRSISDVEAESISKESLTHSTEQHSISQSQNERSPY